MRENKKTSWRFIIVLLWILSYHWKKIINIVINSIVRYYMITLKEIAVL